MTVPATNLRALQLTSSLTLLTQVPISRNPQSSQCKAASHGKLRACMGRSCKRQKYDYNNKQQQQNLKSFPETIEMNVFIWQGRLLGARGA